MKKYIVLFVAVFAAIGAIRLVPAAIEAMEPQVELVTMKKYSYTDTLTVNGTVEELRKKEITLRYPVVPDEVLFEIGDTVQYGDVLATVDTESTKQALLQYASQYADSLPSGMIPDGLMNGLLTGELQTAMAAVDADMLFEKLQLPTKILCSASGTLTSLNLTGGQLFLPQSPVASISILEPLQLRLTVRENDISKIRLGQKMLFSASAVEGGTFAATVKRIYPTAYQKLNGLTYETVIDVLATVQDDFDALRPGYSVRAVIDCREKEELQLLPYEAILQDANGVEYVYVYREGEVQRRDVKTGAELSTSVAITFGVSPYEKIVRDASVIREDGPVKVKNAS